MPDPFAGIIFSTEEGFNKKQEFGEMAQQIIRKDRFDVPVIRFD